MSTTSNLEVPRFRAITSSRAYRSAEMSCFELPRQLFRLKEFTPIVSKLSKVLNSLAEHLGTMNSLAKFSQLEYRFSPLD